MAGLILKKKEISNPAKARGWMVLPVVNPRQIISYRFAIAGSSQARELALTGTFWRKVIADTAAKISGM